MYYNEIEIYAQNVLTIVGLVVYTIERARVST